jgi:hypothetical protein
MVYLLLKKDNSDDTSFYFCQIYLVGFIEAYQYNREATE